MSASISRATKSSGSGPSSRRAPPRSAPSGRPRGPRSRRDHHEGRGGRGGSRAPRPAPSSARPSVTGRCCRCRPPARGTARCRATAGPSGAAGHGRRGGAGRHVTEGGARRRLLLGRSPGSTSEVGDGQRPDAQHARDGSGDVEDRRRRPRRRDRAAVEVDAHVSPSCASRRRRSARAGGRCGWRWTPRAGRSRRAAPERPGAAACAPRRCRGVAEVPGERRRRAARRWSARRARTPPRARGPASGPVSPARRGSGPSRPGPAPAGRRPRPFAASSRPRRRRERVGGDAVDRVGGQHHELATPSARLPRRRSPAARSAGSPHVGAPAHRGHRSRRAVHEPGPAGQVPVVGDVAPAAGSTRAARGARPPGGPRARPRPARRGGAAAAAPAPRARSTSSPSRAAAQRQRPGRGPDLGVEQVALAAGRTAGCGDEVDGAVELGERGRGVRGAPARRVTGGAASCGAGPAGGAPGRPPPRGPGPRDLVGQRQRDGA